jgi:phage I-like protein
MSTFGKPVVCAARRLKAKKEFRLFRFGNNPSTKGTYKLTPESAKLLMSTYRERGLKVTFDYDHHGVKPLKDARPEDGKAAGRCDLELRDDGIWCVNCEWTPAALKGIQEGEWIYFSPAFLPNEETKEILELINVALTNIPALDGIEPLAANRAGESGAVHTLTSTAKETPVAHPIAEHLKKFVSGGKTLADCAKATGIHADRMKELHDGAGAAPSQEEMKAVGKALSLGADAMKAMGVKEDYSGANGETETASAIDGQDVDTTGGDDDDDAEDVVKGKRATEAIEMLALITGTSDPVKQKARAKAMQEKARMADEDHATIVALKAERAAERRELLMKRGKDEGKLTPKLVKHFSTRPPDELEEFLKIAPIAMNVRSVQATETETEDDAVAGLTREDEEVARLCHMSREDFAKAKKAAGPMLPTAEVRERASAIQASRAALMSGYEKMANEEPKGVVAMKKSGNIVA